MLWLTDSGYSCTVAFCRRPFPVVIVAVAAIIVTAVKLLPDVDKELPAGTATVLGGSGLLLPLELPNLFPHHHGTLPTLLHQVRANRLANAAAHKARQRTAKVATKAGNSTAVAAAQPGKANAARFEHADAVFVGERAGLHLGHAGKDEVRDQGAVLGFEEGTAAAAVVVVGGGGGERVPVNLVRGST